VRGGRGRGVTRSLCLEVCAGEGGSTKGLMDAGWDVIANDNDWNRLKRNPSPLKLHGDAFDAIRVLGGTVSLIWAGWPCQGYSRGTVAIAGREEKYDRLIAAGRAAMQATGTAYVIENVEDARSELVNPIMLCGRQFGLRATDTDGTPLVLDRHRLFESNVALWAPPSCRPHDRTVQVAGSYGGARRDKDEARLVRKGGYVPSVKVQQELLGIDWMSQEGMKLSIPPAYSRYIGDQLIDAVAVAA
jgi:DNA (cytosine-5)-methyltransferase 1